MLIFNNQEQNHLNHLSSMFNGAETAVITSPFLMEDLTVFLDAVLTDNFERLTLYSTLPGTITELIKKANSLISVFDYSQQKSFSVEIKIVNKLHGKAYLIYQNGNPINGLISSANLTNSGLTRNHEWGIKIDDQDQLDLLSQEIENLPSNSINEEILLKILYRLEKEDLPEEESSVQKIDLSDIISSEIFDKIENQIWLKPIGHTESPIDPGRKFDDEKPRLYFSKRRPTGVKIDDIIITYGVGARAILSIYKVLTKPEHITEEEIKAGRNERWPWYVIGENLTPSFGQSWWSYDLKLNDIKKEYLDNNPERPLTDAGTQSFGAFNFGADKLHLDQRFGNWLYDKVMNSTN